jgi:hypothetical protein
MSDCCGIDSVAGAQAAGGGGGGVSIPAMRDGTTLWDYDLATQASANIVGGANTIDAPTWGTGAWTGQVAAASTFAFQSGVGLRYISSHSVGTVFTNTTQSASFLYLPLLTVYNTFSIDPRLPLMVQLYISAQNYNTAGEETSVGFYRVATPPNNGASAIGVAVRGNLSGAGQATYVRFTGGVSNGYTTAPGPTANVLTAIVTPQNVCTGMMAVVSPFVSFVATRPLSIMLANSMTSGNTFNGLLHDTSRLVMAFPTTTTAGTHDVTLRRIRLAVPGI